MSAGDVSGIALSLALVPTWPGLRAGGDCDGNFPAIVDAIRCVTGA